MMIWVIWELVVVVGGGREFSVFFLVSYCFWFFDGMYLNIFGDKIRYYSIFFDCGYLVLKVRGLCIKFLGSFCFKIFSV